MKIVIVILKCHSAVQNNLFEILCREHYNYEYLGHINFLN